MNLCEMSMKQIEAHIASLEARCAAMDDADPREPRPGQYVVVRCRDAGVHAGILVESGAKDGVTFCRLRDSRRLWRWWSRFTLSELASEGVRADKVGECRFSAPSPEVVELAGYCEIRPCPAAAERSLRGVPNANA